MQFFFEIWISDIWQIEKEITSSPWLKKIFKINLLKSPRSTDIYRSFLHHDWRIFWICYDTVKKIFVPSKTVRKFFVSPQSESWNFHTPPPLLDFTPNPVLYLSGNENDHPLNWKAWQPEPGRNFFNSRIAILVSNLIDWIGTPFRHWIWKSYCGQHCLHNSN